LLGVVLQNFYSESSTSPISNRHLGRDGEAESAVAHPDRSRREYGIGSDVGANIVMVDVLHHLEFPVMFFREAALLTAYGYRICCGRFDTLAVLR